MIIIAKHEDDKRRGSNMVRSRKCRFSGEKSECKVVKS